jgi:hypothetical protein
MLSKVAISKTKPFLNFGTLAAGIWISLLARGFLPVLALVFGTLELPKRAKGHWGRTFKIQLSLWLDRNGKWWDG